MGNRRREWDSKGEVLVWEEPGGRAMQGQVNSKGGEKT